MISEQFFITRMTELGKAFPSLSAKSPSRLRRYRLAIQDLPEKAVDEIIDTMLDNFTHAPLPKDFFSAASDWKKRNKFYDNQTIEIRPIDCTDCYETGYLFCKLEEKEPETLMFCHCKHGEEKEKHNPQKRILRWEKNKFETVYGFIKIPFPVSWFKPDKDDLEAGIDKIKSWKKVEIWNRKIAAAEEYYANK